MNAVWKFVKEWAKTIAAFVAGVVFNMIVSLVQGDAVWPQTKAEWLQYALTSFGTALVVALTRNKITQKQLDNDKNVIGGVVVATPPPPPPPDPAVGEVYHNPFPNP